MHDDHGWTSQGSNALGYFNGAGVNLSLLSLGVIHPLDQIIQKYDTGRNSGDTTSDYAECRNHAALH